MTRKRWSELSGRQQGAIVAAAVVQQALAAATSGTCGAARARRSAARSCGSRPRSSASLARWPTSPLVAVGREGHETNGHAGGARPRRLRFSPARLRPAVNGSAVSELVHPVGGQSVLVAVERAGGQDGTVSQDGYEQVT